jgi:alpha-beta hydrolase superfamily lysophospholipase
MAEYEELSVSLPDGYRAYARYWHPDGKPIAGVLHLHGIQSHCGWYEGSAEALRRAGFAVLQPDRRGSGRNVDHRGHADSPRQLIDDALCCVAELARRTGHRRHHLLGVSWGGKLVPAVYVTDPAGALSLTLITPGLFPIIDVSAAEKFNIGWSMVSNPERHFDIPLNDPELFTSDPEWIEYVCNDPLQLHQATAAFFLASRRMDRTARKLGASPPVPVHLFLAREERIIDNEHTRRFIRDTNWPDIRITTYDNARHTLEFGVSREPFLEDLVSWMLEATK